MAWLSLLQDLDSLSGAACPYRSLSQPQTDLAADRSDRRAVSRLPGWRVERPNPLQVMSQDRDDIFAFLAQINSDGELREALNLVESAEGVARLAQERGHSFSAAALVELFNRCNEAPTARLGLMDEKLIRVHLKRDQLR